MHGRTISLYRVFLTFALLAASVFFSSRSVLADSFNWQNVNGVNWNSPVKSQWGGTCWDYGTCSEMEAKYMLTRNDPNFAPTISDQQMLYDSPWNHFPTQTGQTGFDGILQFTTTDGLVSETECPLDTAYDNGSSTELHWPLATGSANRTWKTANYQWVSLANLKNAIKTSGPIEMGFNADCMYASVADLKANYQPLVNNGDDHTVSLVGFCDDASCPNGGYWIVKNSWGTGFGQSGYGYVPYGSSLDINQHTYALGPVSYAGPMYHTGAWDGTGTDYTGTAATNTWKGTTSAVWDTTSGTSGNWSNNSTGGTFTWVNQELQAVFDSTGSHKAITVSGTVIAHGLTINSGGTGYSFSGGSLTVTAGGIQANESVSFSSDVYIGGPQSWNVASGKILTVTGPLHTIISDLTFSGAGTTTISGAIDGGGVINSQGAKPGGLIQAGTGPVYLTGATNFSGNITASGTGVLYISPPGGGSATFDGAWFGGGTVNINSTGTFTLGGGASNFTGTLVWQQPVSLVFTPVAGTVSTFACVLNNSGSVTQNGAGTTILNGTNTYTGNTTVSNGVLQANVGTNVPSASFLSLDGGVLQSNGSNPVTFARALGASGGTFQWTGNGGGFSAGSAAMTVNIGNGAALTWGTTVGSQIVGTLKLSSPSAAAVTTFQNNVALGEANRTIFVDDNPNSTADYAVMPGMISGSGGIIKTGGGLLKLTAANSYNGPTTISGGILQASLGAGLPSSSYLVLDGGVLQTDATSFARSLGTTQNGSYFQWTANGGGFSSSGAALTVNIGGDGHTLAWGSTPGTNIMGTLKLGSASATGNITFQNGLDLAGGTQTIEADGNYSAYLNGAISDSVGGGSLLKTGAGTLYLQGPAGNTYTGLTTITGGTVYLNKTSGYAIAGNLLMSSPSDTPGVWTGVPATFVIVQGANQIAPSCVLSFTNFCGDNFGHFELYGNSVTLAGVSGIGLLENTEGETGPGNCTLTINNTANYTFSGIARDNAGGSGVLALVKSGTGTQTLSGDSISYTGGTTISGGTLVLQDVTNTNFTSSPVTDNATLELDPVNSSFSFNGAISGSGSVNVSTGGNMVTLGGSNGNTYTGATTISTGTVFLAKTSGYAIPGNVTIANSSTYVVAQNANPQFSPSAIVSFSGSSHLEVFGNNVAVGGISGAGIIENTEAETTVTTNGTLTINSAAGNSSSYSGYLRNNGGGSGTLALVKNGAGSLTLTGSGVGGYTGGLTVNAGLLSYSGGTAPNCNYTLNGGTLNIGGNRSMKILQLAGGSLTGGTITGSSTYDLEAGTVSIALGGTVGFNKTTPGTVTFTKALPNGGYSISDGVLVLGTLSKTMSGGSLTMTGGTLTGSGTLTAASSYSYNIQAGTIGMTLGGGTSIGLLKSGTGAAIITATEKYGGTTTINGGTLQLGNGGASGIAGTNSITINSGGTFDVDHSDAVTFTGQIGGSGTLANDGAGTLTMSGSNSFAGNLVVNNGLLSYGGNTTTFPSGNFTVNGGTLDFGSLTKTMGSAGVLTLAGGTLSGTGTLTGTSAYQLQAGTVNIMLGGSVGVNKTGAGTVSLLKNLPGGSYAISGGVLNLNAFSGTVPSLQISGGTLTGSGTLTSSTDYNVQAGTVDVVLGGNSVGIHKTGAGTAILTRANAFGGSTTISGGALDADFGATIPASGFLTLDGGMLETLVGGTFTRSFGSGGGNSFQMTAGGGGFSTAGGACAVNIGGNATPTTLLWGTNVGSQLVGTLRLCSPTCNNSVTFLNPIDLGGGARTLEVDDNPNSTADCAVLPVAIGDSVGGGSFSKTGGGTLYLQGAASNAYSGATTIAGTVVAAKTGGAVAIPGDVVFSETGDGTNTILQLGGDNEIGSSAALTFGTSVGYARLELNGHAQTVASINGNSRATIEGLYDNTGLDADSTLTVNNAADCSFAGVIRDSTQGSGAGKVNLVKGGNGDLVLAGANLYTGSTTVNGGTLEVTGSIQSPCGASVASGATLYFNRSAGFLGCGGPITGSGTVQIYQGVHGFSAGTGGDTSLCGFSGTVNVTSGGVYFNSADALGSGPLGFGNGAVCDLNTSTATTIANPLTLGGIGGTIDGYAKPAIYGDGVGGTYTLSGQITLAATSDVGNYYGNGMLTLGGKITGPGGLMLGKTAPTLADEYGSIALSGTTSNDYSGGTTISRGKVYLQKTGGAIAIPGDLTIATTLAALTGSTYLILNGSDQIAPSATMTFRPVRGITCYFELLGNNQTLAGISDSTAAGVIENAEQETGVANLGTLTVDNAADCSYNGYIRNGDLAANGASTGLLALVKSGAGKLTLTGTRCSNYTGGLTVNAGTLDYSGATYLPGTPLAGQTGPTSPAVIAPCPYTINGGTLKIGGLSASIGAFKITGGTVTGTGTLTSNAAYDVRGGRVDAALAGSGIGVTKSGSTLAVLTGANTYTGRTTVNGGVLELGSSAQSCVLNVGGADIQSGAMVFDYAGSSDPMATIASMLAASYDGGHWDVGQFRDSTALATGLTLGCIDDTTLDQVKVMATYPGDFNLDGVVDDQDKAIWFANAFSGTTWQQGDANHDGVVDGLDRDIILSQVGLSSLPGLSSAASLASVPEPGTLALLAAALLSLLAYGWTKRR